MKKRLISIILAIAMIFSALSLSALAIGKPSDQENMGSETIDNDQYERHTISFEPSDTVNNINCLMSVEDQNDANVAQAKDFVLSLNLGEQGYQYIEDSCLNELEALKTENYNDVCYDGWEVTLMSYTVLVPKASNVTPRPFGNYKGMDFYYLTFSEPNQRFHKKYNDKLKLDDWASGIIDFAIGFAGYSVSIPFTLLEMAADTGYKVHTGAYFEYGYNVDIIGRSIYVKDKTTNDFKQVTYGQRGLARPFLTFYPVDPKYYDSYPIAQDRLKVQTITTRDYNNNNIVMSDAYDWYTMGDGNVLTLKLELYPPTIDWSLN